MMPFNIARASSVADEGWSVTKRVINGATSVYDGAKTVALNGKNYLASGTASITPTAAQVSKMIVRTGAVLAVDLAIKALIGAVDYVMDPANSQVVYNGNANGTYYWDQYPNVTFSTVAEACQYAATHGSYSKWKYYSSKKNGETWVCYGKELNLQGNEYFPDYDPAIYATVLGNPGQVDKRTLPYDTVASQIISDATAEKADAKAYVSSVADTALDSDEQRQLVPASNVVNQLNNTQSISTNETAQGTSTPKTDDPTAPKAPPTDIKLEFPVFCGWAPTVCQAAQAVIEFPKTFKSWEKSVTDWVKEPSNSSDKLEFNEPNVPEPDTQINFATGCPEKIPLSFAWNGQSLDFSFDFTIWCQAISTFVYPIVVALGALHALYIVSGVRQDG